MSTLVAQSVEAASEIGAARVVPKRVMRIGMVENIFATSVHHVRRSSCAERDALRYVDHPT